MNHELYFVIRHGGKLERIHRVEVPETTIGRIQTNVLCLCDPVVSRHHAVLIQTPKEFVIRDLRSRNGTRLNGQPIVEAVLPAVSIIEIGSYELKLFYKLDAAQADADGSEDSTRNPTPVLTNSERERREQQLTPAQRRVYDEFLRGHSEKEAARALKISTNTVHSHSRAIYTAFKVSSRAELLSLCAGHLTLHDLESSAAK
ncbi:MAG: FHA domain-containing protein [Planctomycetota bacterium]